MVRIPIALGLFCVLWFGCGSCEEAAPERAAYQPEHRLDLSPAPRPPGLLGDGCLEVAALEPLRDAIDVPLLAPLVPTSAADAIEALTETTLTAAVRGSIEDADRVCGAAIEAGLAVVTRHRGLLPPPDAEIGPRGGSWVGDVLVLGQLVVVGQSREAVEQLAAYLVFALFPDPPESPLSLRIEDGVVANAARRFLENQLQELTDAARAAIAAERRRHDGEPERGDPDVALSLAVEHARRLLGYAPDVGEIRISLSARGGAMQVQVRSDVVPGSPLAVLMGEAPRGEPAFASLPIGTAASYFRAGDVAGEQGFLIGLADIAGERAAESDRAQLDAAGSALSGARTVSVGHAGPVPWLQMTMAGTAWQEPLRSAFAVQMLGEWADAAFDCGGLALAWSRGRRAPCEGAPSMEMDDAGIMVRRGALEDSAVVSEHPAAARAVGAVPASYLAIYVEPTRLPGALTLFRGASLASEPVAMPDPAPVVITLGSESSTLALDIKFAAGAPSAIVGLIGTFGALE